MNFLILGAGPRSMPGPTPSRSMPKHQLWAAFLGFAELEDVPPSSRLRRCTRHGRCRSRARGGDRAVRIEWLRRVAAAGSLQSASTRRATTPRPITRSLSAVPETGAVLGPTSPPGSIPGPSPCVGP